MTFDPSKPVGPLLACAIADAYGAGFEFASASYIAKHNRMTGYIPHPKFQRAAGTYTDDTQMALGLCEHLLAEKPVSQWELAETWLTGFKRDERTGYSQHFYEFLRKTETTQELLGGIAPHSSKNGGAMRAFPMGFHRDPWKVRDLAMLQASLTHATWPGMCAAAAAALLFQHRYHNVGPKSEVVGYLNAWVPGVNWGGHPGRERPADADSVSTVQRAVKVFLEGHSLADVIQLAVGLGGDTDTVAAIAAPAAAVCAETRNALPRELIDGLENGQYGRDYLAGLDEALAQMFPKGQSPAKPKSKRPPAVVKPKAENEGPLDFLFEDN